MYPNCIIYKIYHPETDQYSMVELEMADSQVYLYGSSPHGYIFSENSFIPEEHGNFLGSLSVNRFFYYVNNGDYLIIEKIEIYKK